MNWVRELESHGQQGVGRATSSGLFELFYFKPTRIGCAEADPRITMKPPVRSTTDHSGQTFVRTSKRLLYENL